MAEEPADKNLTSKRLPAKSHSRRRTFLITVTTIAAVLCLPAAALVQAGANAGPATSLYRRLSNVGLDAKKVYNVRDAALDREDIHISLEDGTLAFTESVDGKITGALFDGEGTVLIVPPNQVERHSLGMFTRSAVLNERFTRAYFRFDDSHFTSDLEPYLRDSEEAGDFIAKYNSLAKTMSAMDSLRLLLSMTHTKTITDTASLEFMHARFIGPRGAFDLSWDMGSSEQISVGQSTYTDRGAYYNQWMLFPMRSARQRETSLREKGLTNEEAHRDFIQITKYKIHTQVRPPTELAVDATLTLEAHRSGDEVLLFELSRFLKVVSVTMDSGGVSVPLEYIQNEALEGTELARRGNDLVAVALPDALTDSQRLQLHFHYAGSVLSEAGSGLLYVGARGVWYPNRGAMMSDFEMEFEAPAGWKLLATGILASRETTGGMERTRWLSQRKIPLAGFNLGKYTEATAKSNSGETQVTAYAAEGVEKTFPGGQALQSPTPSPVFRGRDRSPDTDLGPAMPLNPANNAKMVAERARDTIDFLSQRIGPFPYSSLLITQMPGPDSQGWPGLVFLSSHVFLRPEQRAQGRSAAYAKSAEELIYNHLMEAHETAHQWWGDAVFWQSYRDQWLMEALANYCALLEIESHSPEEAKAVLEYYRKGLQTPAAGQSQPRKDAGPVSFGLRLDSAPFPGAYETVAYGRGTWLLHMLRQMLREAPNDGARGRGRQQGPKAEAEKDPDALFYSVLAGLQRRFAGKTMSVQDVQAAFEEIWPRSIWYEGKKSLDWFFDGWVNGTALPRYEIKNLRFTFTGGKKSAHATLLQEDAPDSLVTSVPVYAQTAVGLIFIERVFADGTETPLRLAVPVGTKKLVVDPYDTVLTEK